jgi:hypothetical protein
MIYRYSFVKSYTAAITKKNINFQKINRYFLSQFSKRKLTKM